MTAPPKVPLPAVAPAICALAKGQRKIACALPLSVHSQRGTARLRVRSRYPCTKKENTRTSAGGAGVIQALEHVGDALLAHGHLGGRHALAARPRVIHSCPLALAPRARAAIRQRPQAGAKEQASLGRGQLPHRKLDASRQLRRRRRAVACQERRRRRRRRTWGWGGRPFWAPSSAFIAYCISARTRLPEAMHNLPCSPIHARLPLTCGGGRGGG